MSVEYALRSHRVLEGQAMQDGYRIYRHSEVTDVLVVVLDTPTMWIPITRWGIQNED
jgi:hypothetical protein